MPVLAVGQARKLVRIVIEAALFGIVRAVDGIGRIIEEEGLGRVVRQVVIQQPLHQTRHMLRQECAFGAGGRVAVMVVHRRHRKGTEIARGRPRSTHAELLIEALFHRIVG